MSRRASGAVSQEPTGAPGSRKETGIAAVFDEELVRRALAEDIGRGDVTTEATIPAGTQATARLVARQEGVVAGLPIAERVFRLLDPHVRFEQQVSDGAHVAAGAVLATIRGEARALLSGER